VLAIANRDRGTSDVWLVDLESGRRRKLTVDTIDHPYGIWLPGGKSVAVTSSDPRAGGVDAVAIDGGGIRRIAGGESFNWPLSAWGDFLLYSPERRLANDIYSVSISATNAESRLFVGSRADENNAQFSPTGRFVAYMSNETGRQEVFVVSFPTAGGRWQVSQSGGDLPRWTRDGRELFYVDRENYIVAVVVEESTAGFQMGAARRLFQFHGGGGFWRYDVSLDGERFLVTTPLEEDLVAPVTIITDWTRKTGAR
jgi:Tol biopolymer transport system component